VATRTKDFRADADAKLDALVQGGFDRIQAAIDKDPHKSEGAMIANYANRPPLLTTIELVTIGTSYGIKDYTKLLARIDASVKRVRLRSNYFATLGFDPVLKGPIVMLNNNWQA